MLFPRKILISLVALALLAPITLAEEPAMSAGRAIYEQQCARCHGAAGEGAKKYPQPLVGDKSVTQLAGVIARTMPDDDPETCVGADAKNVAAYMYQAFYSPDAQARLNPPRVGLSRLTVRQYRNSVADLIGSFRPAAKLDERHGLVAEYFASKNVRGDKRVIKRIDPEIHFDFGTDGPDVGPDVEPDESQFNPNQFCIHWEGSITAPETGNYEFIVRTEMAPRLFVNDPKKPLIDALVKSGSDLDVRGSIFLIAGRAYALQLDVYKGRELNDKGKKKDKTPPPSKASVELLWKAPHRPDEVIPARVLSPTLVPEVAVIETPFPPDDKSYGWERGGTISKEWLGAVTDAALDTAGYVANHLQELSGVADQAGDRNVKLRAFCRTFAERAFRRPLTDSEKTSLVDRQFEAVSEPELAVKRVVIRVMTSPGFLYPSATNASDGFAVASRLAMVLWDSSPDQTLLKAAFDGKLATREQIAAQAERMLTDPRARAKVRQFFLAWLRVDQSPELVKDAKRFPGFSPELAADLRTSLELFLDDVVWSERSDFRELLLSEDYFINGRLAAFYGVDLPSDADFAKVKLDSGKRAGVLTHPYVLTALAYPAESSPIHRGVFIVRGLLGVTLRPPKQAFVPLPAEEHPDLTTRDRVALQTNQDSCVTCHAVVNPLGFALEQFDAVGKPRDRENGKVIDVHGRYETREGSIAEFTGARQLAAFLAGSTEVQDAFTQQMFHHFVKQPVRAYGLETPVELHQAFAASGYSIRKLLVEIAVRAAQPK